jgi:hypothetical protein
VEPDFWGYVSLDASGADLGALVTIASECSDLPDTAAGMGRCIVRLGRQYAPKALIGFPPARWGTELGAVIDLMTRVGARDADLVILQTLDRDVGCFEAGGNECTRTGETYWDDADFRAHLEEARTYHEQLEKPLVWWQTPLGVPSDTPGGTAFHYRDNRVAYIFAHPEEFVAAGALGVVFSTGQGEQTNITTDGGQFRTACAAYMANPAPLP